MFLVAVSNGEVNVHLYSPMTEIEKEKTLPSILRRQGLFVFLVETGEGRDRR